MRAAWWIFGLVIVGCEASSSPPDLAAGSGGQGGSATGGAGSGGQPAAGSGQAGGGQAGSGQAGGGQAGGGQAGSGQAGGGQAGSGQAGSGQAGSGQAGGGQAGSGQAGSGQAGGGAAGAAGGTKVRVHYPVSAGHALTIRGSAGGLSWDAGLPMVAAPEDTWEFTLPEASVPVEWKPMIDDQTWSRGPNYLIKPGATVDVFPHFQASSGQVTLYKPGFTSKNLDQPRDVWIYLPPTYGENARARFPVLYMHDGQNLFDASLAFGGNEWMVDETLDQGAETGAIREVIVVGVGNTSARMDEYTPTFDATEGFGGKGDKYLALLVDELRPVVESELRVTTGPGSTAMVGSSLGGLISAYAGLKRPDVFGLVGVMSPSTWWDNNFIIGQVQTSAGASPRALRVYLDSGDSGPSNDDVTQTKQLSQAYEQVGYVEGSDLHYVVQSGASHSEVYWAQRLPGGLQFLLGPRPDSAIPAN
jgi:predicted alpha/beta superfamily hydrolase